MPVPANVTLQVALNAGAPQTGAIVAAFGDVVHLSVQDPTGISKYRWELYEYPEGFTVPGGWSTDGITGAFFSTAPVPPAFNLPASALLWGKYMLRLIVDDGQRDGAGGKKVSAPDLIDERTAIKVAGPNGIEDTAFRETNQFSAQRQWVNALKKNWRLLAAVFSSSGVVIYRQGEPSPSGAVFATWATAHAAAAALVALRLEAILIVDDSLDQPVVGAGNWLMSGITVLGRVDPADPTDLAILDVTTGSTFSGTLRLRRVLVDDASANPILNSSTSALLELDHAELHTNQLAINVASGLYTIRLVAGKLVRNELNPIVHVASGAEVIVEMSEGSSIDADALEVEADAECQILYRDATNSVNSQSLAQSLFTEKLSDAVQIGDAVTATDPWGSRGTPSDARKAIDWLALGNASGVTYQARTVYADVALATVTQNLTLSGAQVVDGTTTPNGARVLAGGQTAPEERGIYVVNTGGAWARAVDLDAAVEFRLGGVVKSSGGGTNFEQYFELTVVPAVLDVDPVGVLPWNPPPWLHTDWRSAHNAAMSCPGQKRLFLDNTFETCTVPPGDDSNAWDVQDLAIEGSFSVVAPPVLVFSDEAKLSGQPTALRRFNIVSLSSLPIFSPPDLGGSPGLFLFLDTCNLDASGATAPIVQTTGTGNAVILAFNASSCGAGTLEAAGAASSLFIQLFSSSLVANALIGAGSAGVYVTDPASSVDPTQAIGSFVPTLLSEASRTAISGLTPGYWGGPGVPATVLEAVNRIAAVVSVGGGTPIP